MHTAFTIETRGPGFTRSPARSPGWVAEAGLDEAVLTLFVRHTSASLVIQENADPDVQTDLEAFFARLVPPAPTRRCATCRHTLEGPDDMPAHIKAALLPVSLTDPGHRRADGARHLAGDLPVRTPRRAAPARGRRAPALNRGRVRDFIRGRRSPSC